MLNGNGDTKSSCLTLNSKTTASHISLLRITFVLRFFGGVRAVPEAYENSQARGLIRAAAAGLHHSHSNTRSKLHVQPTPQFMAMLDP